MPWSSCVNGASYVPPVGTCVCFPFFCVASPNHRCCASAVASHCRQTGATRYKWVLHVLLGVAKGLQAARAARIVHLDVHARNVMVDDVVLSSVSGPDAAPMWYERSLSPLPAGPVLLS